MLARGAALGGGLLAAAVSAESVLGAGPTGSPLAGAEGAGAGGTGTAGPTTRAATRPAGRPTTSPARVVRVGVMGTSSTANGGFGRGTHLAVTLAGLPGVEVAYVCDVDSRNVPKAVEGVSKKLSAGVKPPQGVGDFRRILDDQSVDAMVVATPDHWHSPAAILACGAGKHVYVEKPCCHNAAEGRMLVEAARKHRRLVQHGTQRRTWPALREAIDRLRAGEIGEVLSAKTYYYNDRPSIGRGHAEPVPEWLDWSLWQGPAPEREFHDNYVHYKWHWFWHWGTGELGNNGVHMIDFARWGLGVDYPTRVACGGTKCRYPDDDQQTPDTSAVTFEFGPKLLTWENRSWSEQTPLDPDHEVLFAGEKGFLAIRGGGYTFYDRKGKEVTKGAGEGGDASHLQNFVDGVRGEAKLHAEIGEGYKSALLCNLGNIAYRVGRDVRLAPQTPQATDGDALPTGIAGDPEAAALWGREYRKGWEPKL